MVADLKEQYFYPIEAYDKTCRGIETHTWILTFSKAMCRSFSCSGGILNNSTWQASFISGITLRKINVPMKREHRGSAMSHPNCWMSIVDIITPTLPRVSAKTCRNTPETKQKNHFLDYLCDNTAANPDFGASTVSKNTRSFTSKGLCFCIWGACRRAQVKSPASPKKVIT